MGHSSYLDQAYPQYEHEEENNAADASAADAIPAEESYAAADAIDEHDGNDIPADVNIDEMDQEEIEALAAVAQAKRVFKNKEGKGKGNSSATPSASRSPVRSRSPTSRRRRARRRFSK